MKNPENAGFDPLGRTTEYHHNAAGDAVGVTRPNTATSEWEVNARGRPVAVTDALEQTLAFEYDAAGRITGIRLPSGASRLPSGASRHRRYDDRGRLITDADADGHTTRYRYEGDRLVGIEFPTYEEDYELDARGRIRTEVTRDGEIEQERHTDYDALGNPVHQQDAEGRGTATAHDHLNRPTRITDARGGVTELAYDARDNLIRVTDPEHSTTRFEYDAHDPLLCRRVGQRRARLYRPLL